MRTKEQGAVVGFVIGSVLLLALLVGGIVLYKNNISKMIGVNTESSQVATSDNTAQNQPNQPAQSGTSTNNDQAAQNQAALQQQQQAEQKAQQQQQAEKQSQAQSPAGQSGASVTQTPNTSTAPVQKLPTTGPGEDMLFAAVGLGLMVVATNAYARSRAAL